MHEPKSYYSKLMGKDIIILSPLMSSIVDHTGSFFPFERSPTKNIFTHKYSVIIYDPVHDMTTSFYANSYMQAISKSLLYSDENSIITIDTFYKKTMLELDILFNCNLRLN